MNGILTQRDHFGDVNEMIHGAAMKREVPRKKKDELGFWLCRMPGCGKRIPKGRKSYCSSDCAKAFEIAYFPSATRSHVFRRDNGVCAKCRCDTVKIRRIISWLRNAWKRNESKWSCQDINQLVFEMGFDGESSSFWQADHIQECVRGGWGKGLDNFRTLCTPCHKDETARLARERAEERRLKGSLFEQGVSNSDESREVA